MSGGHRPHFVYANIGKTMAQIGRELKADYLLVTTKGNRYSAADSRS